jgi:uncharacterized membrane protein YeaQ/YmgE (transglycosylase-associated protein family)
MSLSNAIAWILCGLVVGLIARGLLPGRQNMGLLMTAVLGVAGAAAGGWLYLVLFGGTSEPFSLSGGAWQGWIVSILGALLVLWGYEKLYPTA